MKNRRDDLKKPIPPIAPAADPDRRAHPNCGNQPTIHQRNTKARGWRIEKKPLELHRIRKITASFAFIEHRFFYARDFGAASVTMSSCCICFWLSSPTATGYPITATIKSVRF